MRNIYSLVLMATLCCSIFPSVASSSEQTVTQEENTAQEQASTQTIKLYTQYSINLPPPMPIWNQPIQDPIDISLIINGELVVAKNHFEPQQYQSYVEVDKKYDAKEIAESKFIWTGMIQGKKWKRNCVATDMPRYVQEGDINIGTNLYFSCTELKP